MVIAVRCPASACRKYMLVEDDDRGKIVPCLICKQPIPVPTPDGKMPHKPKPTKPKLPAPLPIKPAKPKPVTDDELLGLE